jgi:hypothetical protein
MYSIVYAPSSKTGLLRERDRINSVSTKIGEGIIVICRIFLVSEANGAFRWVNFYQFGRSIALILTVSIA